MTPSARLSALTLAASMLLTACGGGGSSTPATPTPPSTGSGAVTLSASASAPQLLVGASTTLTATVSDNSAVTWQLASGAPGKLSATAGASVTYTAPASGVAFPTAVTVTATAGGATKTVQLVVNPDPGNPGLSLIAGTLGRIVADGTGTAARFSHIADMAAAPNGSLVIREVNGEQPLVRRVSTAAEVTTFAVPDVADRQPGYSRAVAVTADGSAWTVRRNEGGTEGTLLKLDAAGSFTVVGSPDARFASVPRIEPGAAGELFILTAASTATNTCAVYRVTYQGAVSLLAGGACADSKDGRGATAAFKVPSDLTRAPDGSLYVLDNYQLRRIATDGTVTTIAARESAIDRPLPYPRSIAARPDGTLAWLSADDREQIVYSVKPDGNGSPVFRTPAFKFEYDVSARTRTNFQLVRSDAGGRLYLATESEVRVLQNGAAVPLAGLEDESDTDVDGPASTARLVKPMHIASDLRGNLYVADRPFGYGLAWGQYTNTGLYLRKIDAAGNVSTLVSNADFGWPSSLLADQSGNVYIAEIPGMAGRITQYGGVLHKRAPDGTMTAIAGKLYYSANSVDGKGADARFVWPTLAGIAPDGTLYVNDFATNSRSDPIVRKVTPDGTVTTVAALPDDVVRAPDGKRYGHDADTVYRIEADGSHTVIAGTAGTQGITLGPLPGKLGGIYGMTPTGLHTFALISNSAIVKLVVPH